MSDKNISTSQKHRAEDQIWTEDWVAKLMACEKSGDQEGVQRIKFGRYLLQRRLHCKLTQVQAGLKLKQLRMTEEERLGICSCQPKRDRKEKNRNLIRVGEEWSAWENARHLPKAETLRWIAAAVDTNEAAFLRRLRQPIPERLLVHDEQELANDCLYVVREARSFVQLVGELLPIWQQFVLEQIGASGRIKTHPGYAQILEYVYLYLDRTQQLTLASYLVGNASVNELQKQVKNAGEFLTKMDKQLQGSNRLEIPGDLNTELEKLGLSAKHFDGLSNKVKALLERLDRHYADPIENLEDFVIDMSQGFQALEAFQKQFLDLGVSYVETFSRVNTLLSEVEQTRLRAFENICQAFEILAKIQRHAATIVHPPQQLLSAAEHAYRKKKDS